MVHLNHHGLIPSPLVAGVLVVLLMIAGGPGNAYRQTGNPTTKNRGDLAVAREKSDGTTRFAGEEITFSVPGANVGEAGVDDIQNRAFAQRNEGGTTVASWTRTLPNTGSGDNLGLPALGGLLLIIVSGAMFMMVSKPR